MNIMALILRILLSLTLLVMSIWGALALHYQEPLEPIWTRALIALWSILSLLSLFSLWRKRYLINFGYFLLMFCMLLLWWSSIKPTHEKDWADDVMYMASGEVKGNLVTVHNVRNFKWRAEDAYIPKWETRTYDLTKIQSIDLFTSHWGIEAIAHVLVTFGFSDGQFITFTVEIRKTKGQSFDSLAGFFKAYELSIIATDERDAVGVRPNVRGEDTYLYRLNMPKETMRQLFTAYIKKANDLVEQPQFYHTITANCTTIVFDMMEHISGKMPFDYRVLATGYLPEYVQDLNGFYAKDVPLEELTQKGLINTRSKAAMNLNTYSQDIRRDVPGWQTP